MLIHTNFETATTWIKANAEDRPVSVLVFWWERIKYSANVPLGVNY